MLSTSFMHGMPPHIAQLILGHKDINTTMGYKAVYPEEAINGHRAFIARRRELRPSEEYRTPTDSEWAEFLGHFERRRLALGNCGRAYGTPCIHEHSCIRCPLLRPDPAQRPRLTDPRQPDRPHQRSTAGRLDRRGRGAEGQPRRRAPQTRPDGRISARRQAVSLGMPVPPRQAAPSRPPPSSRGKPGDHPRPARRPARLPRASTSRSHRRAPHQPRHSWLQRLQRPVRPPRTGIGGGSKMTDIDWTAAITALDTGAPLLQLAASSGCYGSPRAWPTGSPSLRDTLTGLDNRNISLVIAAVLHATGKRPEPETHDHR